jgi:hypothetical protein
MKYHNHLKSLLLSVSLICAGISAISSYAVNSIWTGEQGYSYATGSLWYNRIANAYTGGSRSKMPAGITLGYGHKYQVYRSLYMGYEGDIGFMGTDKYEITSQTIKSQYYLISAWYNVGVMMRSWIDWHAKLGIAYQRARLSGDNEKSKISAFDPALSAGLGYYFGRDSTSEISIDAMHIFGSGDNSALHSSSKAPCITSIGLGYSYHF